MTHSSAEVERRSEADFLEERGDFLLFLTAVGEEKRFIGTFVLLSIGLGIVVALLLTPMYTAKTVLLPPQQGQGASSGIISSLGAIAATAGVAAAFKTPEELYVGLLKSDSIANSLIDRFKLLQRYEESFMQDVRKELEARTRVTVNRKASLIAIEVDDKEPAFAAELANAYVAELRALMTRIAVTEAQQRRFFYEQQIEKAKTDLVRAELDVKRAQEKTGLFSLDAQTATSISAAAQIRAQIVAREVQLQAARPYAGPDNSELKRLVSELASLRTQLARIESGTAGLFPQSRGDSAAALANVRVFRELKYQEAIYSALLQQLQLAKADESRDAPLIQQVDIAMPPDRKSKPRRSLIVAGALTAGLVLGLFVAGTRRYIAHAHRNLPDGRSRALRRAWSFRRDVPEDHV